MDDFTPAADRPTSATGGDATASPPPQPTPQVSEPDWTAGGHDRQFVDAARKVFRRYQEMLARLA